MNKKPKQDNYQSLYNVSADDIAKYFLYRGEKDEDLFTNLKLQKIVYYAQGIHLALFGNLIFKEDIEAWNYGPVIPELYSKYKKFGSNGIPSNSTFDPQSLNAKLRKFLDEIYTAFGQFSAYGLTNLTHTDSCWKKAFPNKIIKPIAMATDLKKYLRNDKE